jgi:hypothetical protein
MCRVLRALSTTRKGEYLRSFESQGHPKATTKDDDAGRWERILSIQTAVARAMPPVKCAGMEELLEGVLMEDECVIEVLPAVEIQGMPCLDDDHEAATAGTCMVALVKSPSSHRLHFFCIHRQAQLVASESWSLTDCCWTTVRATTHPTQQKAGTRVPSFLAKPGSGWHGAPESGLGERHTQPVVGWVVGWFVDDFFSLPKQNLDCCL